MTCCSAGREKEEKISATHKWDYINLSDFKSTSCFAPLSYGILYITLLISISVYVVDIFVAINLLLFNKWAGQIQPIVPLQYSRWIFAGCIILSLVLLVYRWIRAVKAMRSGGVAQSYLDPLAVRIQSVRLGERGRGWRRFLVFAELTKSKKGAEYIALFTYFSFEAWIRIIFAEGPRKVINAMTLYSVLNSDIIPHAAPKGDSPVAQFFINVKTYADGNNIRAAILFSMLFTLIIWVFAALSFLMSCLFYVIFLWHHIPTQDGSLRKYCKRKIDSRLQKIVDVKINKALAKEDTKLGLKATKDADVKRQPTIPILAGEDSLPGMPLSRQVTRSSFGSLKSNQVDLERQVGSAALNIKRPPFPSRMATNSSAASADSFASNAPLMGAAGTMGSGAPARAYSPAPFSHVGSARPNFNGMPPINRSFTDTLTSSQALDGTTRPPGPPSLAGPFRPSTSMSYSTDNIFNSRPLPRSGTGMSAYGSSERFAPGQQSRQNTTFSSHASSGRASPTLSGRQMPLQEYEMRSQPSRSAFRPQGNDSTFVAYNPAMIGSSEPPGSTFSSPPAQRNFSSPPPRSFTSSPSRNFSTPAQFHYQQRSATAPGSRGDNSSYDTSIYDSY